MSSKVPAVRRLPSEGGTEEILSTSDGGAMGTIVGTPETKYGGKVGDCGVEVPDLMRFPASYTVRQKHVDLKKRKEASLQHFLHVLLLQPLIGQISELIVTHRFKGFSHRWSLLTVSGAAASVRAAPAADVAAAGVRTALAPTHSDEQQEQDAAQRHGRHKHPLWEEDARQETCMRINRKQLLTETKADAGTVASLQSRISCRDLMCSA